MDIDYPKHIERWRGVPENLDAATTWKDGMAIYFQLFKYFSDRNRIKDNFCIPNHVFYRKNLLFQRKRVLEI